MSDADLTGVSCTSAISCTAVGAYYDSASEQGLLAEHWNGRTWSVQATPNPAGATAVQLEGISCTSSTTCTDAGSYYTGSPPGLTPYPLVEHS